MSQLNVDTIKKADGTGNLSVPAETGTVVTTASPSLGRRNMILNGDMRISQRGTSFTKSGSSNVYILDRFYQVSNASAATVVYSQDTEAPANFKNSLKFSVTTADTDLTSQRCLISQFIEGQNVAHLNWGTADAQDVTLSFWVRSSLTGTFGGSFINSAEDYSYPFTYTISSADTWEYKTVTVTGPTAGTWLDTNGVGIRIHWSMGTGSYRLGTAGSWSANRYEGATGQVDPVSTTGATWYITGVQLEVGSVATPFEHRSYGEELIACQRYYYNSHEDGDFSDYNGQQVVFAAGSTTFGASVTVTTGREHPTTMRASPTVTLYHQDGTSGAVYAVHNAAKITGVTAFGPTRKGFLYGYKANGFNQGYGYYFGYTADAEL